MKTSIDIPDALLKETVKRTSAKTKRDAVIAALKKFNRLERLRDLNAQLKGTFVNFMTPAELRIMREDTDREKKS